MSLLIALQICPNDAELGRSLVQLICRIEKVKRQDVSFALVYRSGAKSDINVNKYIALDICDIASTRFEKVFNIKTKRLGIGWPEGPNDMWQDAMMRVSILKREGALDADGVLTFEPDCVPLRPDWLDVLIEDWKLARQQGFDCIGHAHGWPTPTHINGNAIFIPEMTWKYPTMSGCNSQMGWDVAHAKTTLSVGRDTNAIHQMYKMESITRSQLLSIRKNNTVPALFHGVKGDSAQGIIFDLIRTDEFWSRYLEHANGNLTPAVYTYYSPVHEMSIEREIELIELWKKSWFDHGWNPVVLTEQDAKKHVDYALYKERISELPTINPREYETACWLRWMAMSERGGIMTDYDVVNLGFEPWDYLELFEKGSLRLLDGHVPCVVIGEKEEFNRMMIRMCTNTDIPASCSSTWSDMMFLATHPELYKTGFECANYGADKWEQAKLVHFSHHATRGKDRTNLIKSALHL